MGRAPVRSWEGQDQALAGPVRVGPEPWCGLCGMSAPLASDERKPGQPSTFWTQPAVQVAGAHSLAPGLWRIGRTWPPAMDTCLFLLSSLSLPLCLLGPLPKSWSLCGCHLAAASGTFLDLPLFPSSQALGLRQPAHQIESLSPRAQASSSPHPLGPG